MKETLETVQKVLRKQKAAGNTAMIDDAVAKISEKEEAKVSRGREVKLGAREVQPRHACNAPIPWWCVSRRSMMEPCTPARGAEPPWRFGRHC